MSDFPLEIGQAFLSQEKYAQAINWLETIIATTPTETKAYIYLALGYFLKGDESEAGQLWFSLLLENEDLLGEMVEIILNEADHRLQTRQFNLAEKLYQVVIELEERADTYYHLGQALAQQGFIDEAILQWEEALKIDSTMFDASKCLAQLQKISGEYEKAIAVYERLFKISPNDLDSLYQLSLCYVETNNLEKSIAVLEDCLKIDPNSSHILGELGYSLLIYRQPKKGILMLQKMVNHNPKLFQDYCGWSERLSEISDQDNGKIKSNTLLIRSLYLNSPIGEIYFHLSNTFFAVGNHKLGEEFYQKSLEYGYQSIFQTKKSGYCASIGGEVITNNLTPAPQCFYLTARDWADEQSFNSTTYYSIFPESIVNLASPSTIEKQIHCSFWFGEWVALPSSFVVVINKGRFWLNKQETRSAIIAPDNKILGDLSPESPALSPNHPDKHPSKNTILSRDYLPKIDYFDKKVVVLSGLLNNIYFHWLFDILPRIHLLKSSPVDWDSIDYFIVNQGCNFQQETLASLGIVQNKIIDPSTLNNVHIQAEMLIVPSFPGTIAWMPKWACDFLRASFVNPESLDNKPTKRIYIKRNQSSSRRLINEDEIISFLSKFGFEAINLELLSVSQQANLFAQTAIVVSPHGSGLSNIVFCQPDITVIELFSPFYVYPCYWLVANLVGLKYFYVIGEIIGSYHFHKLIYPDSREEDIYLDCHKLAKLMVLAGIAIKN